MSEWLVGGARAAFDRRGDEGGPGATSVKVCVLGSGSGGNCTLVATEQTCILVDAGFSFREIRQRLRQAGEDFARVDAVLITHEHSDHVSGLPMLARKFRRPIYLTPLTEARLDWGEARPVVERFQAGQRISIGDFEIDPFTIPHDAVDPVAFCFHAEGLKLGVVTDLGYMPASVKHHISGCHLLVLESNHDLDMLKVGPYPWFVKQRVMSRVGHLSNHAVAEYLSAEYDGHSEILVLAHLSEQNNHPAIARMTAAEALRDAGAGGTRLVLAEQHRPTEVFQF
ncbi:MAG: MBL fold metallo-hydrolase [Acidobacteria bacterium]|nr:MBL fold metallo-hydrolase [Acidobacteriota bacterium]